MLAGTDDQGKPDGSEPRSSGMHENEDEGETRESFDNCGVEDIRPDSRH